MNTLSYNIREQRNEPQYGSTTFLNASPPVNNDEELSLEKTHTKIDDDLYQYTYDCSICLERLKDPVWCGHGNCSMRSCSKCLIKWCEKGNGSGNRNGSKCPHCQSIFSKSTIQRDGQLRIKIEGEGKEERLYPQVVQQVKEQKYIITFQQKQIVAMQKKIELQQASLENMEIEKRMIVFISFLSFSLLIISINATTLN
jgi:hypothetical protein